MAQGHSRQAPVPPFGFRFQAPCGSRSVELPFDTFAARSIRLKYRDCERIRKKSEIMKNRMRLRITIPMVLGAALFLSACGSPSSSGPTTTAPSTRTAYLCQVVPRVDRLIVTRYAPGGQFVFTFPAVVTVPSASAAQAVVKAACALPLAPKGSFACPAAFAVSYRLMFAVRGEKGMGGEAIVLSPTGCQSVAGLQEMRRPTTHFYQVLGSAMGLRGSTYGMFAGRLRARS